jgi:hypothetical protein
VFTQFREMGELLVEHLGRELGLPEVPFLHGGVPLAPATRWSSASRRTRTRRRSCSSRSGPAGPGSTSPAPATSCTSTAGGTRRSRTRRPTAPTASARPAVTVHTLVTAGTIEDRIAELLDRKRALADAVVGTGETWITELDDDELRELVALSSPDPSDRRRR